MTFIPRRRFRIVLAALVAVLLMTALAFIAHAVEENDFYFLNQTGATITELYVSPGYADDWGPDKLGQYALKNGQEYFVRFAKLHCRYDLRVVWNDGSDWKASNKVNLCETTRICLRCRGNRCWMELE